MQRRARRSARPASARARPTTPTTAPSRPTSQPPEATSTTPRATRGRTRRVLGAYPSAWPSSTATLNPDGTPNTPFVVQDCQGASAPITSTCRALHGLAPRGRCRGAHRQPVSDRDVRHGGVGLNPADPRESRHGRPARLPAPRLFQYTRIRADGTMFEQRPVRWTAAGQRLLRRRHRQRALRR